MAERVESFEVGSKGFWEAIAAMKEEGWGEI